MQNGRPRPFGPTSAAVALASLALAILTACAVSSPAVDATPQATPQTPTTTRPARAPRSMAARRAFQRDNPCPATGKPRGACPGWVVDHIVPLCGGGADAPENMQWQEREVSHQKDAIERRHCAALRATR